MQREQFYSNPSREENPHALPDCEAFFMDDDLAAEHTLGLLRGEAPYEPGWYWWAKLPGCLPDGDPIGPFDTCGDAIADARTQRDRGPMTKNNDEIKQVEAYKFAGKLL